MVSNTTKGLIIGIAIGAAVVLSVLIFIPMVTYQNSGTQIIEYNANIDELNLDLITLSEVNIRYSTNPTAPIINITWDYNFLIAPLSSVSMTFENNTLGTVLTVSFSTLITGFASPLDSFTNITINPNLITNLLVDSGAGSVSLKTAGNLNNTYTGVDLTTAAGDIEAIFNGFSTIGMLTLGSGAGSNNLAIGAGSEVGLMDVTTAAGDNTVTLSVNCQLSFNFNIQTGAGDNIFSATNMSLNNQAITGIIRAGSGECISMITQRADLNGNLTLDMDNGAGDVQLVSNFATTAIGAILTPSTGAGSVVAGSLTGFTEAPPGTYTASSGILSSNIFVDMDTAAGNAVLLGGYS